MVQHADDGIGALPCVDSFIDEVVDLSRDGLTAHTKYRALSWYQEVHRAWLKRIIRVKHLLRHVKTAVGRN